MSPALNAATIRSSQSTAGTTSSSVKASTSPRASARPILSAKLFPCRCSRAATIGIADLRPADSMVCITIGSDELLSTTMTSTV
jgi:hypothetical protein